jgi:hypothetical protein
MDLREIENQARVTMMKVILLAATESPPKRVLTIASTYLCNSWHATGIQQYRNTGIQEYENTDLCNTKCGLDISEVDEVESTSIRDPMRLTDEDLASMEIWPSGNTGIRRYENTGIRKCATYGVKGILCCQICRVRQARMETRAVRNGESRCAGCGGHAAAATHVGSLRRQVASGIPHSRPPRAEHCPASGQCAGVCSGYCQLPATLLS